MSRSLLTYLIKKAFNAAVKTVETEDIPADFNSDSTRREFLMQGAIGMGLLTGLPSLTKNDRLPVLTDFGAKASLSEKQPVITIIGAGMAGLNFAYQLQKEIGRAHV